MQLFAPNSYTLDTVRQRYLAQIEAGAGRAGRPCPVPVRLEVGSSTRRAEPGQSGGRPRPPAPAATATTQAFHHNLDPHYTFETFIKGKSNQLGKAAAMQVATNPGRAYNPLLLYGGTGLGKTHLMHAAGNLMLERNPGCKVMCLSSEPFVGSMIEALRAKSMDEFKRGFARSTRC
ncbi:Chromosomal replication initiator protein DnaA OS=Rhodanobacter lindaniclasticus OX=75310 GN=dnaA PE=3 SV=1 [Rhodanobacter lindaniclasticus]